MNRKSIRKVFLVLLLSLSLGGMLQPALVYSGEHVHQEEAQKKPLHWTCSMHPQVKQEGPGKCPICGMDLIPIYADSEDEKGEVSLKLGKRAKTLAEVETSIVAHRPLRKDIYTVGKMDYDESRLSYVSAWIDGRIDKLFADYTGIRVKKGEHLVLLYSPQLMSAQEEYLLALRDRQRGGQSSQLAVMAGNTLAASREKLLLYGITKKQLKEIEKKGKVQTHLTIYAPISGTVIHKKAVEGMYVKTGDQIYTIADLSRLWLYLDVYEYDLSWIKFGQRVEVTTEAYPGEVFYGTVTFIDPFLSEKTRTVKVRVNVPNPDGRLRPGMYANARIEVQINEAGQVVVAGLEGKYMCPMHPEVIKDKKEKCPICGMDLESIGGVMGEFASHESAERTPALLSIPRSAVLDTGKRKLVYVEIESGKYSPREVKLGPVAGDYYPVIEGLKEGEKVVTSGNFLIDSQMQLAGKPSLMFPEGAAINIHAAMGHADHSHYTHGEETNFKKNPTDTSHNHDKQGEIVKGINLILQDYYAVQKELAGDSIMGIDAEHKQLQRNISGLTAYADQLPSAQRRHFQMMVDKLQQSVNSWDVKDIKTARQGFKSVSDNVIALVKEFYREQTGAEKTYNYFCSMAPGAWLQPDNDIRNPYYGASMLKCGTLVKE